MIRLILVAGILSLATMAPTAPARADPGNQPDFGFVDFCKTDVATNHPDLAVGNCVGSRTTSVHSLEGWSEHVCFFYQNELPDQFYLYYDTYSQCVIDKASSI